MDPRKRPRRAKVARGPERGSGRPLSRREEREHVASPLAPGDWLWLCRAGSEEDLAEELALAGKRSAPTVVAQGLVRSATRPKISGEAIVPAFARQGLPVDALVTGETPGAAALGRAIAQAAAQKLGKRPFALHVIVADSDAANRRAGFAREVEDAAFEALCALEPAARQRRIEAHDAAVGDDRLVQACLLDDRRAAVGTLAIGQAPSLARGGRRRISAPAAAPSRAAAKLLEAFDWLGRAPDPGEVCIDLGAAPGGWSQVLLDRRCKVIAVDPARLAPHLVRDRNLQHVQRSAFEWLPDDPADWLFCDMAWRPLEVAALLAKWGRRGAARFLVANIKLPMKKKVELLARVREILATGGWRDVRVRQLYHDRDEVTLAAWRLGT